MIRHEIASSILRFYNTESADPFQTYDAVCTLVWESNETVWIKSLHGTLTRKTLRELLIFLVDHNVRVIKAHRAEGHTLPFTVLKEGTYTEVSVELLANKFLKNKNSN